MDRPRGFFEGCCGWGLMKNRFGNESSRTDKRGGRRGEGERPHSRQGVGRWRYGGQDVAKGSW